MSVCCGGGGVWAKARAQQGGGGSGKEEGVCLWVPPRRAGPGPCAPLRLLHGVAAAPLVRRAAGVARAGDGKGLLGAGLEWWEVPDVGTPLPRKQRRGRPPASSRGKQMSVEEVKVIAEKTAKKFPNVDPLMLRAIAEIESSRGVNLYRYENALEEASLGMCQVLMSTATWLATDMGYGDYGVPSKEDLMDPEVSMYYAAAYLAYLSNWRDMKQSEEFVVRAYNGGPGGAARAYTMGYYHKYVAAKEELLGMGPGGRAGVAACRPAVIVKAGDTLGGIAKRQGTTLAAILAVNPSISNPDRIRVGDSIAMPVSTYVVASGDTLVAIARCFSVPLESLLAANPQIKDPNSVYVGEELLIPHLAGKK